MIIFLFIILVNHVNRTIEIIESIMADDDTKDEEIDVFEIDDFTAASEWERFIYRIEEIVGPHGWKLNNNQSKVQKNENIKAPPIEVTCEFSSLSHTPNDNREQIDWEIQSECLNFANFNFTLSHHKLKQPIKISSPNKGGFEGLSQALIDSFDVSYDFPPRAHCLSRWYGVKEFLVLSPTIKDDSIDSESRTNLLWSSVGIALSNLKCQLPVFLQIGNKRRRLHYGMCVGGGFRTSYEMIHLQYTPHECNHVQGMIDTFKAKLAYPVTSPLHVSIRFTYIIKEWPSELCCPPQSFPEPDDIEETVISYGDLPLGPLSDPINDLQLAVSWPSISSDMLNDDSNFSDLNPEHAPQWWLKVRCCETSDVVLYEHLKSLLQLCKQSSDTTAQIIRSLSTDNNDDIDGITEDVTNVLDRLVDPGHTLSYPLQNVVSSAARKVMKTRLSESPIPEPLLKATLDYLFPDANLTKEEALSIQRKLCDEQETLECDAIRNRDHYRNLKSAPIDSLTYNLALCIFIMNYEYGGIQGVSHLWHEFVLEMRYRFENNITIPRLAQTIPNLNYCLVHQKLQMLNYCIQRRQQRNAEYMLHENVNSKLSGDCKTSVSYKEFERANIHIMPSSSDNRDKTWGDLLANIEKEPGCDDLNKEFVSYSGRKSSSSEDSDDEFFEAQEELTFNLSSTPPPTVPEDPEGVLEETDMKLLKVDKPLNIPITQQPPPLTEDVLIEQQDVMTRLGTSEEAARVRAQMQSASLISDMEAFKAANPGCMLEDFVRWYSPNDWLQGPETEEEKIELSNYINEHKESIKQSEGWEFELDDELNDNFLEVLTGGDYSSEEGHLSFRMRVPGNAWNELWSTSRPVPIRRQKRLFDDTKEAEKVLHFLSRLRPCEIALQLFPVIIHACITRINREEDSIRIPSILEKIIKDSSKLQSPSLEDFRQMEYIVKDILKAETLLSRMQSLRLKFYPDVSSSQQQTHDEEMENFIHSLLNSSEVCIKGGSKSRIGKIIKSFLFNEEKQVSNKKEESLPMKKKFPHASGREYILRTTLPIPSGSSRLCPQRLFTVITPEEFRMAGSFTRDTNFI